jgi:3' terminal RNA ribose 2'-O-methyltransferase Hen1
MHEQRLEAVVAELRKSRARQIVDLGCGDGALLERLARERGMTRIAGVDVSADALRRAGCRLRLGQGAAEHVSLFQRSIVEPIGGLEGFDAAVLVETIEHIDPDRLSMVEKNVFGTLAPGTVIVTTPNSEYNPILGVPRDRFRHPEHRFEWDRQRFRSWCRGVSDRNSCAVRFRDVPFGRPGYGGPTQMAVFSRIEGTEYLAA